MLVAICFVIFWGVHMIILFIVEGKIIEYSLSGHKDFPNHIDYWA